MIHHFENTSKKTKLAFYGNKTKNGIKRWSVLKILDCTKPPPITNGKYNETLVEKYRQGQVINGFHCDPGFLPSPADGLLECGPEGWLENGICNLGLSKTLYPYMIFKHYWKFKIVVSKYNTLLLKIICDF